VAERSLEAKEEDEEEGALFAIRITQARSHPGGGRASVLAGEEKGCGNIARATLSLFPGFRVYGLWFTVRV
jgi:hypothetical protein